MLGADRIWRSILFLPLSFRLPSFFFPILPPSPLLITAARCICLQIGIALELEWRDLWHWHLALTFILWCWPLSVVSLVFGYFFWPIFPCLAHGIHLISPTNKGQSRKGLATNNSQYPPSSLLSRLSTDSLRGPPRKPQPVPCSLHASIPSRHYGPVLDSDSFPPGNPSLAAGERD